MGARYRADMLIRDVLTSHQDAARVFARHGLACPSCLAADMETLGAVAHMHDVELETLIAELNALPEESAAEEVG